MIKTIASIIAIAGLEAYAIHEGINGTMLGLALVALAGLGGFNLKSYLQKRKEK